MTALEETFIPGRKGGSTGPTGIIQKDAKDANYWEQKAREAKAEKEYKVEQKEIERIEKGGNKETEPAFKVTGAVNLGNFDLQEQQRQMEARMKEIEAKYEQQIGALSEKSDNYREELHKAQIAMLSDQFNLQMKYLTEQIARGANTKQPSFIEQMDAARSMAEKLGYQPVNPAIQDASLQLQILKMNNDNAREAREFEWKMKQYDLERDARIQEIKDNNLVAMEKVKLERERNNMLASLPETIGGAIARGLLDSGNPGSVSRQPQRQAGPPKQYRVEAGIGQQGEIGCPNCQTMVAILPDTEVAICASCGAHLPVIRTAPPQQELAPEEAERAG